MYDLLLKKARLLGSGEGLWDIGIRGDLIAEIDQNLGEEAEKVFNLNGKLVIPAFVDVHTHLEKTLTAHLIDNKSGTLDEAINNFQEFLIHVSPEDIYKRARLATEMAIKQGTTALRSHITVDPLRGLDLLQPILELKKDLRDVLTIQVVAFPGIDPTGIKQSQLELLQAAVFQGADLIGGCPSLDPDHRRFTDLLFTLGKELDVDIDLHVDESDQPNVEALEYLADKTISEGYEGRVTAGHCCALSVVSDQWAERVIQKIKRARINIVTLPSCNLFLTGAITRVRSLMAAGVPVSYASDNIRDPFRPFGNGDLLEEALLTAQVTQRGTLGELEEILKMGTYNPAKVMCLEKYGLKSGCYADLIVLQAASPMEAIVSQAVKEMIFHRGQLIVTNSRQTSELWKTLGNSDKGINYGIS